jgi:hypothetical protein
LSYAAAPVNWPQWHPSSLRIYGREGALAAGEVFAEDIHAGGRAGHLRWDVLDYQPGRRWQASARGDHGLALLLTYECVAVEGGCEFIRTLQYGFDNALMRLANSLLLSRRIERESQASMLALQAVLEGSLGVPVDQPRSRTQNNVAPATAAGIITIFSPGTSRAR